jgi:hypothetical protein
VVHIAGTISKVNGHTHTYIYISNGKRVLLCMSGRHILYLYIHIIHIYIYIHVYINDKIISKWAFPEGMPLFLVSTSPEVDAKESYAHRDGNSFKSPYGRAENLKMK